MAVELKIGIEENCDSLFVFDQTGSYDLKCNKTGWGSPNQKVTDATGAVLRIYPPNTEDPIIIDVYPDFPNNSMVGYEILPEDLGMEKFVSGIWRFDYVVTTNAGDLIIACYKQFVEDIKCCLEGKRISVDTSNFESKEVIQSNNMFALFESSKANACEGKIAESEKIMSLLYNKCNCSC